MIIIAICGGSGSGKTTLAEQLHGMLGQGDSEVIALDDFYLDYSTVSETEFSTMNVDLPECFDLQAAESILEALASGQSVSCPQYDFKQHRASTFRDLKPPRYLIVEGLYAMSLKFPSNAEVVRCFVEAPMDIMFIRRLLRNTQTRSGGVEAIAARYLEFVREAYVAHVRPQRDQASVIIDSHEWQPDLAAGLVAKMLLEPIRHGAVRTHGSGGGTPSAISS